MPKSQQRGQKGTEMVLAVIDTNVLVSYFVSKGDTPPVSVVREMLGGRIIPLFNEYLLEEYRSVLSRPKFGLDPTVVNEIMSVIESFGIGVDVSDSGIELPDRKDIPIFEIAISTRDAGSYLVTGNTKHFPKVDFVVTPKQMMDLLESTR